MVVRGWVRGGHCPWDCTKRRYGESSGTPSNRSRCVRNTDPMWPPVRRRRGNWPARSSRRRPGRAAPLPAGASDLRVRVEMRAGPGLHDEIPPELPRSIARSWRSNASAPAFPGPRIIDIAPVHAVFRRPHPGHWTRPLPHRRLIITDCRHYEHAPDPLIDNCHIRLAMFASAT